jgi:hypothetical protein
MLGLAMLVPGYASAQSWLPGGWAYRRLITVTSPADTTLTSFQVKVTLPTDFAFAHAKPDGSDLRVTTSDGTTLVPFHLDLWSPDSLTARLWVRVPSIPAAGTTLYVYYGNPTGSSVSDGDATFEFFDDFASNFALGYYPLGPSQTIMVQDQTWENEAPHSLSVVPAPAGAAYPYYGYYGLEGCTGIGMAGSTDMVQWTKFDANPLFTGGGERWPHVIKDGATYHMVHTVNFCGVPGIVRRTSTDGLTWSDTTQIVDAEPGWRNQNPNLWHDPNDGKYYLYWFQGDLATVWRIMARSATSIAELDTATSVELLSSPRTLAAPNLMYRDGTYFLVTETFDTVWKVVVYGGPTPLGPFTVLPGNPILGGDCACMLQHQVGDTVYEYYCKRTGGVWTLDLVQADLSAGRQSAAVLDTLRWQQGGGSWSTPVALQHDGSTGPVAENANSQDHFLQSSYTGSDYVFETQAQLIEGRVLGIGVRMADPSNGYSINLYDDLDDTDNIYIYQWVNGEATEIWKGAAGPIEKNTWYKLNLKVGSQGFKFWLNDSLRTPGWVGPNPGTSGGLATLYLEDGTRAQFDDVRVLKFAPDDPTTAVGGEATPNTPPVAVISAPANDTTVWPGQAATLTSGAHDAQDPPGALAYRWDVRLHTDRGDSLVIHTATTQNSSFTPPMGNDSTLMSYRVIHQVTDSQGASDSTSIVLWPEVDLQPAALGVTPAAPVGSDSLTFSFTLHNRGRALAPRTRWRLMADGTIPLAEGDQAVPGLDSAVVRVRVGPLGTGTHTLRVTADTLAVLRETDETNNAATFEFTTTPNSTLRAVIATPADSTAVWPEQAVALTSGSHDTQDPQASLAYRWDVRLHTNRGDSLVIHTATTQNLWFAPPAGDDSTIVYFRVVHRVTNLQGLSDSTSIVLLPEIDLEPAALAVTPAEPMNVDSLTFSFILHNRGRALAPLSRWRVIADDSLLVAEGDTAVPRLDSVLVTVQFGPLMPGPHTLRVVVDTMAVLCETVETNNAATLTFSIGNVAGVDAPQGPGGTPRDAVALSHPFPNPSRGQGATLELVLAKATRVELAIYDISGRMVRRLLSAEVSAGARRIGWDGRDESGSMAASALYMVRLQAGGAQLSRRIMVLR